MFVDQDDTPRVIRQLGRIGTRTARAGIFTNEVEAEKLGFQEFGTETKDDEEHVPQRQTIAPAFDASEDDYVELVAEGVDRTIAGGDGQRVAGDLAKRMADDQRTRILSNTPPVLADSTIAARRRRGNSSTNTLVDEGDMLKAIEHDVIAGEGHDDG